MTSNPQILIESRQAPARVAERLREPDDVVHLADLLRRANPPFAMTVARGSSDHAANFARYLLETGLGLVTASAAPSVVTTYRAHLKTAGAFVLALSQSGQSPDILTVMRQCREAGAITAAFLNVERSPLATEVEHSIPIGAGLETAIAATKSFIGTLVLAAMLLAHWRRDDALLQALSALPDRLAEAAEADWSAGLPDLAGTASTLVIARGCTYAIAQEAALKLKEVCALHAEPFSSAEVQHGPMSLVEPGYPMLILATQDETLGGVVTLAEAMRDKGARILLAAHDPRVLAKADIPLPLPAPLHPVLDPIIAVQAFYPFVTALAQARGYNPDAPRHLRKVTQTR